MYKTRREKAGGLYCMQGIYLYLNSIKPLKGAKQGSGIIRFASSQDHFLCRMESMLEQPGSYSKSLGER